MIGTMSENNEEIHLIYNKLETQSYRTKFRVWDALGVLRKGTTVDNLTRTRELGIESLAKIMKKYIYNKLETESHQTKFRIWDALGVLRKGTTFDNLTRSRQLEIQFLAKIMRKYMYNKLETESYQNQILDLGCPTGCSGRI
jgi:hypothetical protein